MSKRIIVPYNNSTRLSPRPPTTTTRLMQNNPTFQQLAEEDEKEYQKCLAIDNPDERKKCLESRDEFPFATDELYYLIRDPPSEDKD